MQPSMKYTSHHRLLLTASAPIRNYYHLWLLMYTTNIYNDRTASVTFCVYEKKELSELWRRSRVATSHNRGCEVAGPIFP
jgi:hypothetical protein